MDKNAENLAGDVLDEATATDINKNDSNKKNNKPKSQTVFVGFYRNEGGELYALHPQALSSEESMINKIKLMYGNVDIHIFSTELPA